MEINEIYRWIAVLAFATLTSICRALDNRTYRDVRQAAGMVGCSSLGSAALVAFASAYFNIVKENIPCCIGLAVILVLGGEKLYDRLSRQVLTNAGLLRNQDSMEEHDDSRSQ